MLRNGDKSGDDDAFNVPRGVLDLDTEEDERGTTLPEPKSAPRLSHVVHRALGLMSPQVRRLNVVVSRSLDEELALEIGAERLSESAVISLLCRSIALALSALEFSADRRELRIEARKEGGVLGIEVVDNGTFIPVVLRESWLDFTPLRDELSRCGGTIESAYGVDRGNVTRLVLGSTRVAPIAAARPGPIRALKPARVLVVEDSPEMQRLIAELLREGGHVVDQAADGYQALLKLRQQRYDLVLLDMGLPRVDGPMVLRVIRLELPAILARVVLLTAFPEEYGGQASTYKLPLLEKPLDVARFHEVVDARLSAARA